jgi:hypothetical protein
MLFRRRFLRNQTVELYAIFARQIASLRKSHPAKKALGSFILCRHPIGEILSPSQPPISSLIFYLLCTCAERKHFQGGKYGFVELCVTRELIKGGKTNTIFLTSNKGENIVFFACLLDLINNMCVTVLLSLKAPRVLLVCDGCSPT